MAPLLLADGRIKFTCQTLLRDGGQEVYSFLCSPLSEESD